MTPVNWTLANYMVFVHAILGSLVGNILRREAVENLRDWRGAF